MPATIPGLAPSQYEVRQPVQVVADTAGTGDPRNSAQVHAVQDGWNNLHGNSIGTMFLVGNWLTKASSDWSWR